jgi:hypothetical protein
MKKAEVEIGESYEAKVSGRIATVTITSVCHYGGWYAKNMATGKTIRIKGAQRLRKHVPIQRGY